VCGIVGLLAKTPEFRQQLGEFVTPMLVCMGDRGPDSAGLAVFTEPTAPALRRFSLFAPEADAWRDFEPALANAFSCQTSFEVCDSHAALTSDVDPAEFKAWMAERFPAIHLLSVGRSIEVYKDAGHPRDISERYRFARLPGTHAVGHTRMATESAVSPAHAHPFTAGEDFCLVHNGSLSNPYSIRRKLEKRGITFETDNDTEAACRFLEWRLSEGDDLETALARGFDELDGFYTLLIGTADALVLVRDAFACKPAVAAETDDYIAISSEFRAIAHLPGIRHANLFEPAPERIYTWHIPS
jgi:glutamate synthase domain-containing protein 1